MTPGTHCIIKLYHVSLDEAYEFILLVEVFGDLKPTTSHSTTPCPRSEPMEKYENSAGNQHILSLAQGAVLREQSLL